MAPTSDSGASLAIMSELTGATFISPSLARARHGGARRRSRLRVGAEKIEEIRLRRVLVLLRLLRTAEQEIEQAFGGSGTRRKHNGACDRGGDKHQAAPLALNRQLVTQ